jgi:hypothetical protein
MERYNLGEVTGEEKQAVEAALVRDPRLKESLAAIRRSDGEIRDRYPPERVLVRGWRGKRRRALLLPLAWSAGIAALLLVIALPFFRSRFASGAPADRVKGGGNTGPAELSAFLKSNMPNAADTGLRDQTVLYEGSTIQLAYKVKSPGYGVIFSIDGRSAVTLHFPYVLGQSARLIPGKRTALDEAYTLDDAPDYELFFFVVSDRPLDASGIMEAAEELARDPDTALDRSAAVFGDYEVKTLTLRKE